MAGRPPERGVRASESVMLRFTPAELTDVHERLDVEFADQPRASLMRQLLLWVIEQPALVKAFRRAQRGGR